MSHVPTQPAARRVDVALDSLVLVLCPRCKNPLGQDNLKPGAAHRYRCKRCEEWTVVIAVAVQAPQSDPLTVAAA